MTTFLIIISFILHAISFLIIILLFYRLERTKDLEKKQSSTIKEMENLLSSYILEMKEENVAFLEKVNKERNNQSLKGLSNKKGSSAGERTNLTIVPEKFDKQEEPLSNEAFNDLLPGYGLEEPLPTSTKANKSNDTVNFESLSLKDQVKLLYNQGSSIEEIARRLSKGKTEIELLLKFYS
jgi:hypothetical protein